MLRLIRWLCFPIARRLGVWPIAVYYGLAVTVVIGRRLVWPLPEEAALYVPGWVFPAVYAVFLLVFPLLALMRRQGWYRVPDRR